MLRDGLGPTHQDVGAQGLLEEAEEAEDRDDSVSDRLLKEARVEEAEALHVVNAANEPRPTPQAPHAKDAVRSPIFPWLSLIHI